MKKFIGNKQFYKMILLIAVPIMIQNGITNFVGMLDNIMVGQVGTTQMSGVAIINQLMLVFNVTIFGAVSAAGIFGAQYYGCRDYEGVRNSFRFKMMICIGIGILSIILFIFKGDALISLYLHEGSDLKECQNTLYYAKEYLIVMLFGLLPFAVEEAYSSTLRETGETVLPMKAGIVAVLVNLVFNYIFIFGKLGCPPMGAAGAAIATVISRFVQAAIVVVWTHRHLGREEQENIKGVKRVPFMKDVYSTLRVPGYLAGRIAIKGTPLLINEALWSIGMAGLMQCYSIRGLSVVAGMNISNTISNVFAVVYMAMGSAIAIILGQLLGAGKMEEAKDHAGKLIFFSVTSCIVIGLLMTLISSVFPQIYKTSDEIKGLAEQLIIIAAICMPLNAFTNASYFTLRSGGKTVVTFLFDSVFVWTVSIPAAYVLSRYTDLPIVPLYLICQSLEMIKCIIGFILVRKGVWIQNMTQHEERY